MAHGSGRTARDDAAEIEHGELVADVEHQRHVVVDEQHSDIVGRQAYGATSRAQRFRWDRARQQARRARAPSASRRAHARPRRVDADRATVRVAARRASDRSPTTSSASSTSTVLSARRGATASTRGDHQRDGTAPARRFSRTVRSSNSSTPWNVRTRPARARWCGFNPSIRRPASDTMPSRQATKPHSASIVVVFPAPFGPIRPTILPAPTCNDRSCTACKPPKLTDTSWTSSSGLTRPPPSDDPPAGPAGLALDRPWLAGPIRVG